MNTTTKGIKYKTLYKLKARNTAPSVQWGCPKQSEHNHENGIKYKTVQAESQEYITFSAMRLSYKSGHKHKNGIKYKTLYKLKAKITAPVEQKAYPTQSEHNNQNGIKYKT